jgi:hypothetical protein
MSFKRHLLICLTNLNIQIKKLNHKKIKIKLDYYEIKLNTPKILICNKLV